MRHWALRTLAVVAIGLGVLGCKTTPKDLADAYDQVLISTGDYQERTGTEVVGTVVLDANTNIGLLEAVAVQNPSRITMTFLSKGKKVEPAVAD